MSHIVQIQTEVREPAAICAACERLKLPPPQERTVQLFSGEVRGWAIELAGWRYPAVCEVATGRVKYDNFEGRWGSQQALDRFLQAYAVERAKLEARRRGHTFVEQTLSDGSIRLSIQVAGGQV